MPLARQSQFPEPRAKTLGAWAKKPSREKYDPVGLREERLIATALVAAMDEHQMSNVALGRLLGINESIVRRIRERERPLGARHLLKLEAEAPDFFATLMFLAKQVLCASATNDNGAG